MSILPKCSLASAIAAPHCPITRPSHRMGRMRPSQPSRSLRLLLHSLISSRNSALRSSFSSSSGGRHATTLSPWSSSFRISLITSGVRAEVRNHVRGELCVAMSTDGISQSGI
jgi:hypothetical protein